MNLEKLLARLRKFPVVMDGLRAVYELYNLPRRRLIASVISGQSLARFNAPSLLKAELLADRAELLRRMPAGSVAAEIGVDNGDYSQQILEINAPRKLHLVDLWGSLRYSQAKMERVKEKLSGSVSSGIVEVHRASSLDAAALFSPDHFDFVYIDTDHSYSTTIAELRAWAGKVKPGGFILGHDFVSGNFSSGIKYGVMEAVAEFLSETDWEFSYLTMDFHANQSFGIKRPVNV